MPVLSLYLAGEPWLLEGVDPGGVVEGEPWPELEPEVSDLLREPCLLRPVPICDVNGNGAGVASEAEAAASEDKGIKGLELKWPWTKARSRLLWASSLCLERSEFCLERTTESSLTTAILASISASASSSSSSATMVHLRLAAATSEGVKRPSARGADKGGKLIRLDGR